MAIIGQLLDPSEFARLTVDQREFLDRAVSAELLRDRALLTRLRKKVPELQKAAASLKKR